MTPQMQPYTPSLYQPDSFGRYRKYPHFTDTPIPGAGYQVGQLFWGEQELNLDGSREPQHYGNYSTVPLRGLGQVQLTPDMIRASLRRPLLTSATERSETITAPGPESGVWQPPSTATTAEEIAAAAAAAEAAAQAAAAQADAGPLSFLTETVGPVPVWAIGLAGLAVLGGGGYWLYRRRKVRTNRRRRWSRRAR